MEAFPAKTHCEKTAHPPEQRKLLPQPGNHRSRQTTRKSRGKQLETNEREADKQTEKRIKRSGEGKPENIKLGETN